jgi:hypothetical protein
MYAKLLSVKMLRGVGEDTSIGFRREGPDRVAVETSSPDAARLTFQIFGDGGELFQCRFQVIGDFLGDDVGCG